MVVYAWSRELNRVAQAILFTASQVHIKSTNFVNFFHTGLRFWFLPAIFMPSTYTDRNRRCFRCTIKHFQFATISHPSPNGTFSNCLSPNLPASGAHTDSAQEEPLGLQCLTKMLATCVVEDISKHLGNLTFGSFNNFGASFILTWVQAGAASAACAAHPGSLAMTSTVNNTAWEPESSFTLSPRNTTPPGCFWNFGANSAFLRWLFVDLPFALHFGHLPSWQFLYLPPILSPQHPGLPLLGT